jgi:hypothetical protein
VRDTQGCARYFRQLALCEIGRFGGAGVFACILPPAEDPAQVRRYLIVPGMPQQ